MKRLIHLSDLHYRLNWEEDQELVLNRFFKDLEKQLPSKDPQNTFFVFSGDVVLAGGKPELYSEFMRKFDVELNNLNIPTKQRICIPGNHDVSQTFVATNNIEHEGIVTQNLSEKEFNDFISRKPTLLTGKFENYITFESGFADFGIGEELLSGKGWNIEENIGVYCLNTALCSSGGYNNIDDKGKLKIDTRSLHKWLLENKSKTKVLVMHHPIEWLNEWSAKELLKILNESFSLCLSGHIHDQSIFHSFKKGVSLVQCSAPPLLTNKKDYLGYSIISLDEIGVTNIQYRQWTKNNSFVTGVNFSDTDNGKIEFEHDVVGSPNGRDRLASIFSKRLNEALQAFSSQPIVWVDPILSDTNEISTNPYENANRSVNINEFVAAPQSTIIKAPPQFGLTCLAHFLVKEAWNRHSSLWLYLDSSNVKPHAVEKALIKELETLELKVEDVKCIVLDSWTLYEKDSLKLLKNLSNTYKEIPIVVMQTIDDTKFINESNDETIDRPFDVLHLLALPRGHIRQVISAYNSKKLIGDEDAVISKVTSDLEVLNIHRTPLNCLTLLKVAEKYFDESPVNRTKMLEMVLFLLFDMKEIPTYKSKPDLKDCEYVLGRYCEQLLKGCSNSFTREDFLKDLKNFCSEKLIDLEVDVVFDVLYTNNIIVRRGSHFCFRFTYWIYYFVAQRMHQDPEFAKYMLEEKRYVTYPEVIEFYTGIDRRREDALKVLVKDLKEIRTSVEAKVGLPHDMNVYKFMTWNPTEEIIEQLQEEIGENVSNSNLPETLKDQYADETYDQKKPYDQTIRAIFKEYSLSSLFHATKATSRALRNSDYVDPQIKRELMQEITSGWEQMTKILVCVAPILSEQGQAAYDDQSFYLKGHFGDSVEEKLKHIYLAIPRNVSKYFQDDIYSNKVGPLLYDQLRSEESEIKRHEIALLIVRQRPRNWKAEIQEYIASVNKNSYFLFDITTALSEEYKYSYAPPATLRDIEYLIKMGFAKHEFGVKKPGLDKISKISNKALPKREVGENDSQ